MAGPEQCTDINKAMDETVLMGIRFVGDTGRNLDDLIAKALASDAVRSEIRKTLDDIAQANVQGMPLTFSGQDAKKFAAALAERSFTAVRQEVWAYTLKSPQYLRLKKGAERVVDALKCSPTGVWVDKNKKLIYILAAGVVLAGAVGMYITRMGDEVTAPLSDLLAGRLATVRPIGSLELAAGAIRFEPSRRQFQVELGATADIKQVKVELALTAQAIDTDLRIASARGRVVIPFGKVITRYEIAYDPDDTRHAPVQLGLGVEFGSGRLKLDLAGQFAFRESRPVGNSVALGIKGTHGDLPYSARAEFRSEQAYGSALLATYTQSFW